MTTERVERVIPIDALPALCEALQEQFGARFGGCSGIQDGLEVRVTDATETDRAAIQSLVLGFDLDKRTREQVDYLKLMALIEAGRKQYTPETVDNDLLRYLLAELTLLRSANN